MLYIYFIQCKLFASSIVLGAEKTSFQIMFTGNMLKVIYKSILKVDNEHSFVNQISWPAYILLLTVEIWTNCQSLSILILGIYAICILFLFDSNIKTV